MHWRTVVLAVGCLGATSCIHVWPGTQMTELPTGLSWCSGAPENLTATTAKVPQVTAPDFFPTRAFDSCTKVLLSESEPSEDEWKGSIVLGLTTNEQGQLSSVCVYGGDYGNPKGYLRCIVDVMHHENVVFPKRLDRLRYRVTFIYD
jgi:hypothetical protein